MRRSFKDRKDSLMLGLDFNQIRYPAETVLDILDRDDFCCRLDDRSARAQRAL